MMPPRSPRLFVALAPTLGLVLLTALAAPAQEKTAAKPPGVAGWKKLFDGRSLESWKETDFYKPGKVRVQDGTIVMEKGNLMTGVTYARGDFPKMDYEVTLEGKRLAGHDFFCTATFPVGDSFCSLVVGGWGGRVIGLSSLNGADASENETGQSYEFKDNHWYRVRVRISRKRIEAWIDAKKLVDVDTDGRKISVRIECLPCRPFGIATWDTTGAVRDIRVRRLTAAEKKELAARESDGGK
jgi:hypothetical protein